MTQESRNALTLEDLKSVGIDLVDVKLLDGNFNSNDEQNWKT